MGPYRTRGGCEGGESGVSSGAASEAEQPGVRASEPGGSPRLGIDALPDELLLSIFSHLSFSELVDVVRRVCSRWERLAQDADLWADKEYWLTSQPDDVPSHCRGGKTDRDAVQAFRSAPGLRTVLLQRGAKARVLRALAASCPRLTRLRLHPHQKLGPKALQTLVEKCPGIRTLTVCSALLARQKLAECVSRLQQLRTLEIQPPFPEHTLFLRGAAPRLRPLAAGCPLLAELRFGSTLVDVDELRHFLSAKEGSLKSVQIAWRGEGRRCVLPALPACAGSLECLDLGVCDIQHQEAAEALTALGSLENLRHLTMMIANPAPPGTAALAFESGGLGRLRVLDLKRSPGLDDEAVLAVSCGCHDLRELTVADCRLLTDHAFAQIHRLAQLEMLDVSGCKGLSGGFLSSLGRLPRLQTLLMAGLQLPEAAPGLASILALSSVRSLALDYSTLTGMPYQQFPDKLVSLRELYVHRWPAGCGAVCVLMEKMPGLRIYVDTEEQLPPAPVEVVEVEYEEEDSDGALGDVSEAEDDEDSVG